MATKKKYSNIDLSKYNSGYKASQDVVNAQNQKLNAENAVTNYGDFNYGRQDAYDQAINALTNREKFKYDLNGDALYQQYKDQYITQGKQAMMDTIGQASAMTGGYGNSYAATVGNQTYQGYLQQLNNKIPELYQLALDKYNSEGDQLAQTYGVLAQDRQTAYGEWGDTYNRLVGERDYSSNEYNNAYNRDYTTWNDNKTYDTSQYWNEYNTGYQADRDAIADAQWQKQFDAEQAWKQKEFDEALRQYNEQMALQKQKVSYSSGGSGGTSGGTGGGTGSGETASGNGKTSVPSSALQAALKLYNANGQQGVDQYLDENPNYDAATIINYCKQYGDIQNSKSFGDRKWTVVDDGGINWFGGVDNNAKLQDHYGNTYTAKQLKAKLKESGYSDKQANDFLKKYEVYK